LNDHYNDGDYYWESTGQLLGSYNNWYETHPVLGEASCAILSAGEASTNLIGKWVSAWCNEEYSYICESVGVQCLAN